MHHNIIYIIIAQVASKISPNSHLFWEKQWCGMVAAGWTARSRRTFGQAFSHADHENQISGVKLAMFLSVVRQEIWTPDIWPWITNFSSRREARNLDASYFALNRPFSLLEWCKKYWDRYLASYRQFSLLTPSQKYGRKIFRLEQAVFIAVCEPEIWTPDIWLRIGFFYCRREARDLDARFVAKNRPFFVVFWGLKSFFIAIARPGILTQMP